MLTLTPVAGVVAGLASLISGDDLLAAFRVGFGAGGAFFVTWAIARELHPDRPWVAGVAAVVAPFGTLLGSPDLLAGGLAIVIPRIVGGTTGRAAHWIDIAVVLVLAGPLALRDPAPGVLVMAAMALALAAPLQDRRRLQLLVGAAGCLVLALGSLVLGGDLTNGSWNWLLIAGIGAGVLALLGPSRVETGTDRAGGTVDPRRIRAARFLVLAMAIGGSFTADPSFAVPLWTALAAVALRPT